MWIIRNFLIYKEWATNGDPASTVASYSYHFLEKLFYSPNEEAVRKLYFIIEFYKKGNQLHLNKIYMHDMCYCMISLNGEMNKKISI